ncbi:hypothetical protein [Nocardia wallacei]|uniref:hypothetical protein n=1 Tax=Nocardia wallacei TaxID=480035 RepID=UPI0024540F25|nr:hypothetical protein [Nocardia wallacei]
MVVEIKTWNPAVTLSDWLCERLEHEHAFLAETGLDGNSLAAELLKARRIIPVLDGFDELPSGYQGEALRHLSALRRWPLILTSRSEDYVNAVEANDVLTAAHAPLHHVLATPLMLYLARVRYSDTGGADPAELLNRCRFPDRSSLEQHLIAEFIPTAYRVGSGSANSRRSIQVQRWLRTIAYEMDYLASSTVWWVDVGASRINPYRSLFTALCVGFTFLLPMTFGLAWAFGEAIAKSFALMTTLGWVLCYLLDRRNPAASSVTDTGPERSRTPNLLAAGRGRRERHRRGPRILGHAPASGTRRPSDATSQTPPAVRIRVG